MSIRQRFKFCLVCILHGKLQNTVHNTVPSVPDSIFSGIFGYTWPQNRSWSKVYITNRRTNSKANSWPQQTYRAYCFALLGSKWMHTARQTARLGTIRHADKATFQNLPWMHTARQTAAYGSQHCAFCSRFYIFLEFSVILDPKTEVYRRFIS